MTRTLLPGVFRSVGRFASTASRLGQGALGDHDARPAAGQPATGNASGQAGQDRAEEPIGVDPDERRLSALLSGLSRGDRRALGDLYDLCVGDMYGLALWRTGSTDEAGEVIQTVFVKLAERGGRLPRIRSVRAYLLRMVHSAAVDLARRERRFVGLSGGGCRDSGEPPEFLVRASTGPSHEVGPAGFRTEFAGGKDLDRTLDERRASRCVACLPPKQREAIYLHVFGQMTFAEAGRVLGVPPFTAASRYRLGIARLRRLLGVRA